MGAVSRAYANPVQNAPVDGKVYLYAFIVRTLLWPVRRRVMNLWENTL